MNSVINHDEKAKDDFKDAAETKMYTCLYCNNTYSLYKSFLKHLNTHLESYPNKCFMCNKSFRFQNSLTRHNLSHHEDVIKQSTNSDSLDPQLEVNDKNSNIKLYKCSMCSLKFANYKDFLTHEKSHGKLYQCSICNELIKSASDLINHLESHSEKMKNFQENIFKLKNFSKDSIECELCKTVFKKLQTLRHHLYRHINFRPYKCEICDKRFTNKSVYKSHFNEVHIKNSDSSTKSSYKNVYNCDLCEEAFTSKLNLKEHSFVHKSKTYNCSMCEKSFMLKSNLNKHILNHEKFDVENLASKKRKFFKDNFPDNNKKKIKEVLNARKNTSEENNNRSNFIISNIYDEDNKNWKCNICGKGFSLVTKLNQHQGIHGKMPLFDCDLCEMTFPEMEALNKHTAEHNSHRHLQCLICNKIFSTKYSLTRHSLVHAKNKD